MKKLFTILAALAWTSMVFGQAAVTRGGASGLVVQQAGLVFTTPVLGVAGGTSLTLSSLTSGRVPFMTTAGLLTDAAAFTFNSGTGALSATSFVGSGASLTAITAANISVGALANGMTSTTQSAGDNSTKNATTAYSDNAGLSTILGTFASPNTAAGAVTWSTSKVAVTTSAAGATRTYTLPAAASYTGKSFFLTVGAGANHVNVQPASGAALVLSGVLLTADHYIQAATSAVGNSVVGFSDGTNWQVFVCAGTWADAASP